MTCEGEIFVGWQSVFVSKFREETVVLHFVFDNTMYYSHPHDSCCPAHQSVN